MKQSGLLALSTLTLISTLFWNSSAHANSSIFVQSPFTQQNAFEVVYASDKQDVELEPGIYATDVHTGEAQLIAKGNVLGVNRGFNGAFAHFNVDGNPGILIALNGKLSLVVRTDASAKTKKLAKIYELGSKDFPLVNLLDQHPVQVDSIQDMASIKTLQGRSVTFVSIEQKNIFGSGITFAISMKEDPKKRGNEIITAQVVAFNALDRAALTKLDGSSSGDQVAAPVMYVYMENLLEHETYAPLFSFWQYQLAQIPFYKHEKGIKVPSGYARDTIVTQPLPVVSLSTHKPSIQAYPFDVLYNVPVDPSQKNSQGRLLAQSFDPFTRKWTVHWMNTAIFDNSLQAFTKTAYDYERSYVGDLKIDYNVKKKKYEVYGFAPRGEVFVVRSEDQVKVFSFLSSANGTPKVIELQNILHSAKDPKQMTVFAIQDATSAKHTHVIISYIDASGKKRTSFSTWSPNGSNSLQVSDYFDIDRFFTYAEIQARMVNLNGMSMFDVTTPEMSLDAYLNKINTDGRKVAYRNLSNGLDSKVITKQFEFIEPLVNTKIIAGQAEYNEYDTSGYSGPNVNGITLYKPGNIKNPLGLIQARRLTIEEMHKLKMDDPFVLDSYTMDFHHNTFLKYPRIKASLVVFGNSQTDKFTLGIIFHQATPTPDSYLSPFFHPLTTNLSLENFAGIKLLQGKREHEDELSVLISYKGDPSNSRVASGLTAVTVKLELNRGNGTETGFSTGKFNGAQIPITVSGSSQLTANSVNEQTLRARLKTDLTGSWYWVESLNINSDSSQFAVRKLGDNKLTYPNQSGLKIRLKEDETIPLSNREFSGQASKWLIDGTYDLNERFKSDMTAVEKIHQDITDSKKTISPLKPIEPFPGFKSFFDSFAQPADQRPAPSHQVVFVNSEMKKEFKEAVLYYLRYGQGALHLDYKSRGKFALHWLDDTSTGDEIKKELIRISESANSTNPILFANSSSLFTDKFIADHIKYEDGAPSDDPNAEYTHADIPILLASEGQAGNLYEFKKLGEIKKRIPMIIFTTPEEWFEKLASAGFSKDLSSGVFNGFAYNYQFYVSNWAEYSPKSKKATPDVAKLSSSPISEEEQRIFPELNKLLLEASSGQLSGKQKIIVVPEKIKPLINKLILTRWASNNQSVAGAWNYTNPDLGLYRISGDKLGTSNSSQENVIQNFESLRAVSKYKHVVLFADMAKVLAIKAPAPASADNKGAYMLKDTVLKQTNIESASSTDESSEDEPSKSSAPHMFWLMATEGQKIPISNARGWSLSQHLDRKYASIILATPNELEQLEKDLNTEAKYLDVKRDFEFVHLSEPTVDSRYELIRAALDAPQIRGLDYQFSLEGYDGVEAKRQLLYHLVNRTEQIAKQSNLDPTVSFIRVFSEFRRVLVDDTTLRHKRVIDKNYVERFFSRVFPLPMNPGVLEPNDPFKRLSNSDRLIREWREGGYEGPNELKKKAINALLTQQRPPDSGRPLPSSMILIGDTGSGKTELFLSLARVLNLVPYDYHKANNEDADYIVIKAKDLVDKENGKDRTVDQAIEDVLDLLAQPKGHRSWILFDDIHKAPDLEVYTKLMTFYQKLIDADRGMIEVKRKDLKDKKDSVREIPVQNLTVVVTLNPEAKEDVNKQFLKNPNDIKGKTIAALSYSGQYKLDQSVLARVTEVVNLDAFPRSAKTPALVKKIREVARHQSRVVLVEPQAVNAYTNVYTGLNVRELIAPSADAFNAIPALAQNANMYIITPRKTIVGETREAARPDTDPAGLQKTLRTVTSLTPVSYENADSQIKLVEFLINNFRNNVFNHVQLEGQNHDGLNLNVPGFGSVLRRNFLFANSTYLLSHPRFPVSEATVRQYEMPFMSDGQFEDFYEKQKENSRSFFQLNIPMRSLRSDVGFGHSDLETQTEVLVKYVKLVERKLLELMALEMRLNSVTDVQDIPRWTNADFERWFTNINSTDSNKRFSKLSKDLIDLYLDFYTELYRENIKKDLPPEYYENFYDTSKTFSIVMDKAVSLLPWGTLSYFTQKVVDFSQDLRYSQNHEFGVYKHESNISPFAMITADMMNDVHTEYKAYPDFKHIVDRVNKAVEKAQIEEGITCQRIF